MKLPILLVGIILSIMLTPVYAYELVVNPIDPVYYFFDEQIFISGTINPSTDNSNVAFRIGSDESTMFIWQVAAEDGLFEVTAVFGPSWQTSNYTLTVTNDDERIEIPFEYFAELPPIELTVFTDKTEYVEEEYIIINGNVDPIIKSSPIIMQIIHNGADVHITQLQVAQDGSFTETVLAEGALWQNSGEYIVRASYNGIVAETTFEYTTPHPDTPVIQIQTDKSEYHINENIFVSGTMTNIDWSENTDVLYEIYANSSMFESGTGGTLNDDGTFNFTIHTLGNELWDNYSGQVEIIVTIQNYTASTFFNYYNTPNMSNEVLYNMIIDLTDRFDSHYATHVDYNNVLITQNEMILSLQEDVTVLTELINALSNRTPMDAPQIIGLIADDPHNQDDNYGFGDTITILFDSDTNMPGGNGVLRKMEINYLFTFSDYVGSAYSGKWTDASTFVITVKNVGDALVTINSTTVTPALGTLILPADNNPENFSIETSPVLIGDWGIPVQ